MAYETPHHIARLQAHAPYYSKESLDSRRGRSFDGYAELLRDSQLVISDTATLDIRGHIVSADDETHTDSSDGALYVGD